MALIWLLLSAALAAQSVTSTNLVLALTELEALGHGLDTNATQNAETNERLPVLIRRKQKLRQQIERMVPSSEIREMKWSELHQEARDGGCMLRAGTRGPLFGVDES